MNIESQQEKISSFQHLELLANQVVEGFISGMHKSPFHGFRLNLRNIKPIILAKAPSILTGNCLPKQIDCIPNDLRKKPIYVVTSLSIIHRLCIIQNSKKVNRFMRVKLVFLFWPQQS